MKRKTSSSSSNDARFLGEPVTAAWVASRVHAFGTLESTMDVARAMAITGEPAGSVVRASVQTAGRGRLDRIWQSPMGGLWFTLLLRPSAPPARWGLLSIGAGCAVADALAARRFEPRIKWPNDVLIGDRKVAGVLAESRPPAFALVGVGINAAVDPAQWSPDLRSRARTLGLEPSEVEALFDEVVARLLIAGRAVDEGDTIALQEAWERFARIRGTPVVRGSVQGTAEGLAEDGALLVRSGEGTLRRLLE